jgi:hypothetical protein
MFSDEQLEDAKIIAEDLRQGNAMMFNRLTYFSRWWLSAIARPSRASCL